MCEYRKRRARLKHFEKPPTADMYYSKMRMKKKNKLKNKNGINTEHMPVDPLTAVPYTAPFTIRRSQALYG